MERNAAKEIQQREKYERKSHLSVNLAILQANIIFTFLLWD